ncbi:MAG: hypothetical protein ACTTIC_02430 [Helicobacteraceae bacterium]
MKVLKTSIVALSLLAFGACKGNNSAGGGQRLESDRSRIAPDIYDTKEYFDLNSYNPASKEALKIKPGGEKSVDSIALKITDAAVRSYDDKKGELALKLSGDFNGKHFDELNQTLKGFHAPCDAKAVKSIEASFDFDYKGENSTDSFITKFNKSPKDYCKNFKLDITYADGTKAKTSLDDAYAAIDLQATKNGEKDINVTVAYACSFLSSADGKQAQKTPNGAKVQTLLVKKFLTKDELMAELNEKVKFKTIDELKAVSPYASYFEAVNAKDPSKISELMFDLSALKGQSIDGNNTFFVLCNGNRASEINSNKRNSEKLDAKILDGEIEASCILYGGCNAQGKNCKYPKGRWGAKYVSHGADGKPEDIIDIGDAKIKGFDKLDEAALAKILAPKIQKTGTQAPLSDDVVLVEETGDWGNKKLEAKTSPAGYTITFKDKALNEFCKESYCGVDSGLFKPQKIVLTKDLKISVEVKNGWRTQTITVQAQTN